MSRDELSAALREEFGGEILRRLDDLSRAIGGGEVERALRLGHTFKGSALALGLERVAAEVEVALGALRAGEPALDEAGLAVVRARRAAVEEITTSTPAAADENLAALGHDLRTPLGAVAGFAQLLRDSELTVEQRRCVEGIVDAADQLEARLDAALGSARAAVGTRAKRTRDRVDGDPETPAFGGESPGAVTIVYVEDDPASAAMLERLLHVRPGVRLVVAVTGAEGLALAAAMRPDLVLLDLGLPDLDGTEVFRKLRAFSSPPAVAVVSGDARPERIAELREAGVDEYFEKPVDTRRLLDLVDGLARS